MTPRTKWNLAALAALLVIGGGGVGTLACWRVRQQRLTRRMVELLQEEGRGKFERLAMASRGTAVRRLPDEAVYGLTSFRRAPPAPLSSRGMSSTHRSQLGQSNRPGSDLTCR